MNWPVFWTVLGAIGGLFGWIIGVSVALEYLEDRHYPLWLGMAVLGAAVALPLAFFAGCLGAGQ